MAFAVGFDHRGAEQVGVDVVGLAADSGDLFVAEKDMVNRLTGFFAVEQLAALTVQAVTGAGAVDGFDSSAVAIIKVAVVAGVGDLPGFVKGECA